MNNLISQSIHKLYSLTKTRNNSGVRFKPTEKDVYLVSYPRSGNTWMRVIMSELLYGKSGESIEELQNYVPDIHQPVNPKELIDSDFHVVKSHYQCVINNNIRNRASVKNYKKVIYIVRDPRDVLISYYKYMNNYRSYNLGFEDFMMDFICGRIWPCSWQDHVNSWLGLDLGSISNPQIEQIEIIKYEDLLSNPEGEILKLSQILNKEIKSEDAHRAIKAAAVEKMRHKESQGMPKHERKEQAQFIGEASNKQWENKLTVPQLNLIEQHLGSTMKRFGYGLN